MDSVPVTSELGDLQSESKTLGRLSKESRPSLNQTRDVGPLPWTGALVGHARPPGTESGTTVQPAFVRVLLPLEDFSSPTHTSGRLSLPSRLTLGVCCL